MFTRDFFHFLFLPQLLARSATSLRLLPALDVNLYVTALDRFNICPKLCLAGSHFWALPFSVLQFPSSDWFRMKVIPSWYLTEHAQVEKKPEVLRAFNVNDGTGTGVKVLFLLHSDIDPIPILCVYTPIAGMPTLFGLVSHFSVIVDRDHYVRMCQMDDRLTVRFLNIQDVDHM